MKSFIVCVCVVVLAMTGCSSAKKELEQTKAQLAAAQADRNALLAERDEAAAIKNAKETRDTREAEVRKAAAEAAAEAVKKLQPTPPPTREDREAKALADAATSSHGASSIYVPKLDIEMSTGPAASEYQKRMAAKEAKEGEKEIEVIRSCYQLAFQGANLEANKAERKAERKAELEEAKKAAMAKEQELQAKITNLQRQIVETQKALTAEKVKAKRTGSAAVRVQAGKEAMMIQRELVAMRAELAKLINAQAKANEPKPAIVPVGNCYY